MLIDISTKTPILKTYLSKVNSWHKVTGFDSQAAINYLTNKNLISQEVNELLQTDNEDNFADFIDALLDILWEAGQVRMFLRNYFDVIENGFIYRADILTQSEVLLEDYFSYVCFPRYLDKLERSDDVDAELLYYLNQIYNESAFLLMYFLSKEELEAVTKSVATANFSKFLLVKDTSFREISSTIFKYADRGIKVHSEMAEDSDGNMFIKFLDAEGKIKKPASFLPPAFELSKESEQRFMEWFER